MDKELKNILSEDIISLYETMFNNKKPKVNILAFIVENKLMLNIDYRILNKQMLTDLINNDKFSLIHYNGAITSIVFESTEFIDKKYDIIRAKFDPKSDQKNLEDAILTVVGKQKDFEKINK